MISILFFLLSLHEHFSPNKNIKKKKLIILTMLLLVVAISGYTAYRNNQSMETNLFDVCLSDCEAIAGCEIYNSNKELIVSCSGDSGVCWSMGDLYCSGKKTN